MPTKSVDLGAAYYYWKTLQNARRFLNQEMQNESWTIGLSLAARFRTRYALTYAINTLVQAERRLMMESGVH